jgi:hypothetical protein
MLEKTLFFEILMKATTRPIKKPIIKEKTEI